MYFGAAFRGLPVETLLPKPPDTECALATFDATGGVFCLLSGYEIPNPAPVVLSLARLGRSIAENGLVLEGVPVPVLPGVEGDSPPILTFRAPDRGVTFPLSFELAGDRKSSLLDVGGAVSERRPRRGGLTGDAFCDPASLGVKGLLTVRRVVLNVGVKGLAGVPLFCLSMGIVKIAGFRMSAG
jgi:hypothetical protein